LIKFIVASGLLFFLQACATAEKPVVDPVAMYKKGMEEGNKAMVEEVQRNLKQKNAYGYVEPYYPLRLPSDVRKVWIVDHPNEAGDLIQGHWVFMVVTPGRWASPSIPPVHPDNGERTSYTVPVIEDKPVPSPTGAQGKVNASQSQ
jgi:Type IV conjugative transfer system lipoprotein (TraV)